MSDAANAAAYVTPLAADPAFVGISTFEPIEAVTLCTDFGIPTSYDCTRPRTVSSISAEITSTSGLVALAFVK